MGLNICLNTFLNQGPSLYASFRQVERDISLLINKKGYLAFLLLSGVAFSKRLNWAVLHPGEQWAVAVAGPAVWQLLFLCPLLPQDGHPG